MNVHRASPAAIAEAARLVEAGQLVAFPTETVYGLGADAFNDAAVARIFAAKGRPRFNPLIVHVANSAAARRLVYWDSRASDLVARFWPGPLSLVMRRRADCGLSLLASAGLDTVAVRAPDHPVAQALLRACERPIAAPSANRSSGISPTTAAHVVAELGANVRLVLDDGACRVGLESTVLDLSGTTPAVLRPGAITHEAVADVVGPLSAAGTAGAHGPLRSPGLLSRHYAPGRQLRLNAAAPFPGEALLGFGPGAATLNLSVRGDVAEAAANLFAMLRALDEAPGFTGIAVSPIPEAGLGMAINDRLRRAATPPQADDWHERGPAAPCVLPGIDEDA